MRQIFDTHPHLVSRDLQTYVFHPRMYIYILLDTVLATDVNEYSLASASCQPIWWTSVGELDLFLAVAKDCGIVVYLNQSQQSISPCFG